MVAVLTAWARLLKIEGCRLGIRITDGQLSAFDAYLRALLESNRRVNLTSITDPQQVAITHFLDSLTCLLAAPFPPAAAVVDVGSGAGLPGIPLAIARPDLRVTLIESTGKKCHFLERVVGLLRLRNMGVMCARAEAVGHDPAHRESYDVVVARALAEAAVAAELCLPLAKVGGAVTLMKGPRAAEEIERAGAAISILGGEVEAVRRFTIKAPGESVSRTIVVVRKNQPTPDGYPRAPGRPGKRPLGIDTRRCEG
jgi:16S rRNA (guanine527-N7)-methyltransferase